MKAQSSKPRRFYVRKFLNRARYQSVGFILMDINPKVYMRKRKDKTPVEERSVDVTFTIGDCSRQISLDFWISDTDKKAQRGNDLAKITMLHDEIGKFKDAYIAASEWCGTGRKDTHGV